LPIHVLSILLLSMGYLLLRVTSGTWQSALAGLGMNRLDLSIFYMYNMHRI